MFKIKIENLNLFGYHGVREIEKKDGQNFRFNIEIIFDRKNLSGSDKLEDTLNYSKVIKVLKDINSSRSFNLLETLSQKIAVEIMKVSTVVEKVSVEVEKTSPPIKENLESVGIEYVIDKKSMKNMEGERMKGGKGGRLDVYMSLGSNIGDREKNLRKAAGMIGAGKNIDIIEVSSIYETEPMYFKEQNSFYNIVLKAKVSDKTSPFGVMGYLKKVESGFGNRNNKRYGPRAIDIDILYYGDMSINSEFLTIPHPRIEERKFVMVPLSEIDPDFKIKGSEIKSFIEKEGLKEKVDLIREW
ncbi:MAG: 2-amino-4-hydroxy-6-hydroxymethyldihydropteridine diphosphokinase [Actinomycetota bacterium]|nr:2-amino-4-hydroxy-6-hydroxymethyldihydropteridine diphosphokinase [Actinomycetota bacterium]